MVAEEYDLNRGSSTKSHRNFIGLAIIAVLAIAIIVAVVLSVIILVKVSDAPSSATTVGPTATSGQTTTATTAGSSATTSGQNISCKDQLGSSVTFREAAGLPLRSKRAAKFQQQLDVNVPTLPPISEDSPKYKAYMDAVNRLKFAINTSADPCNDFWGYACGNYPSKTGDGFRIAEYNNYVIQGTQIMKPMYQQDNAPLPLKQTVWFFNKCVDAMNDFGTITHGGAIVINALKAFQDVTGLPFPMLNQNTQQANWPSATTLGTALGYLSGVSGVHTLLLSFIDVNALAPRSSTPYFLYIDQNSLSYLTTVYAPGTWDFFQPDFITEIQLTMRELATLMGLPLDPNTLMSDTMDIIKMELTLARNFSTDDATRRQFRRSYNPITITQAQSSYPFIDWMAYFKQLSTTARSNVQGIVNNPNFTFSVMETAMISKLSQSLVANNAHGFTPRQLVNYLAYRHVANMAQFLPRSWRSLIRQKLYRPPLAKPRYIQTPERIDSELFENKDFTQAQLICTEQTVGYLQYANARFFVDALYPDKGVNVRKVAGAIITSIVSGFQSMIDQLPWMDSISKVSAYGKINNLVENIAFPDFIIDDNQLTQYHSDLNIAQTDDYIAMLNKLTTFVGLKQWDYLAQTACSDRYEFSNPPGIANAWYQPEVNSITLPAGILQPPFFDPDYPVSLNYGAMGVIAAHELTHGYNDEGVQWDGVGKLASWMSPSSEQGFHRLASCVINEYNGFCPLPANYTPNCINGAETLGENIADNGGIHAAWRAYKTYTSLNGPDPRLPDPVLEQFTHDQLFFLGFAHIWCEKRPDADMFLELLLNSHSPSQYRVFGTIQNIPAFQTAFNCPTGSKYAPGPGKHCNVWVLDN